MEKAKVVEDMRRRFPEQVTASSVLFGDEILEVKRPGLVAVLETLKEKPYEYAMLLDLTCVDLLAQEGNLEMVYTVFSLGLKHRLRLKVKLPQDDLYVPSLTPLWKNANWLEREVYDMFGVQFDGHPDLRRLFMYEGFEGHPLRKSYPLRGRQPRLPMRK